MYQKIEQLVNEKKLRFSGNHKVNLAYLLERYPSSFLERIQFNLDFLQYLPEDKRKEIESKESIPILKNEYCFRCGSYITYSLSGDTLVTENVACFNDSEITVDLPVPSGRIILSDWYKGASEVIRHLDDDALDINCMKDKTQRTFDYAKEGVGHIFVGNSSPSFFQKQDLFLIGNDEYDDDDNVIPLEPDAKEIGSVCTDLWWVTLCDLAVYQQIAERKYGEEKGKELADKAKEHADIVVDIDPGLYRLRYFTEIKKERELYATFEKISNLDLKNKRSTFN